MTKTVRHALGALALALLALACAPLGACTSSASPVRPIDQLTIAYTAASAGVLAYSLSGHADPAVAAKLSLARDVAGAALANVRALSAQGEVGMVPLALAAADGALHELDLAVAEVQVARVAPVGG